MKIMNKFLAILMILSGFSFSGCIQKITTPAQTPPQVEQNVSIWQQVFPGISSRYVSLPLKNKNYDFLLVKIDPHVAHFQIYENEHKEAAKTIQQIHREQSSKITFNGAFFGADFRPISFLLSDGKVLHPLSKADLLNGVFFILKDRTAHLEMSESFEPNDAMSFAIQNGPVLLDKDGKNMILSDDEKLASRTTIGLDQEGNVMVMILKTSLLHNDNTLSLHLFADSLQNAAVFKALGLHSVLNLDGGPSTGIMIDTLYYPEMERVENVIIVK